MNKTCKLLRKSFYEDEWSNLFISGTWCRSKDNFILYEGQGIFEFWGSRGIIIPWYLRPYMKYQIRKGQNLLNTKKWLDEEEKQNKRYTVFLTSSDLNPWVQESALLSLKEAKEIRKELSRINPKKCYVIFKVTEN